MKKRLLCLLLMCLMILSFIPTAGAADVKQSDIKGDGNNSVTFYVKTGNKWKSWDYIKLDSTKGILRAGTWTCDGTDEDSMPQSDELYGYFHVKVWKKSGDDWQYESKSSEDCWNGSSHKIKKLQKNAEYKISIESYSMDEICNKHWMKYSASIAMLFYNVGATWNGADAKCVNIKWDSNHVPVWSIDKATGSCTYSM